MTTGVAANLLILVVVIGGIGHYCERRHGFAE